MGVKYQVKHIIDGGLWRLRSLFPSQLSSWTNWPISGSWSPIILKAEDAIAVVYMARKANVLDLLPVAYYTCCTLPPSVMVDGVDYDEWERNGYHLNEDDLKMCHAAQAELLDMRMRVLRVFMEGATGAYDNICVCKSKCRSKMQQLALRAMDERQYSIAQCFSSLNSWIDGVDRSLTEKMCSPCRKAVKNDTASQMKDEWAKLGKLFNIEDWPPNKS